jgi:hypothetical protein
LVPFTLALKTYPAFLTTTKSWPSRCGLGLGLRLGSLFGLLRRRRSSLLGFGLLGLLSLGGGGGGLLGLLGALILLSTLGGAAKLNLDEILSNSDGIFLVHEELLDGTGFRSIDRNINLAENQS